MAGTTRARALVRRRVGRAGALRLAGAGSVPAAVSALAGTPYGHEVRAGDGLEEAQHAVLATLLWHVRVLAGWLPRDGTQMLRLLARWFEIANTDELLHGMAGGAPGPEFDLGALATSWPRLREAATPGSVASILAASPWGDPGGTCPQAVQLGMRLSWAVQVAEQIDGTTPWAAGAVALLTASERHVAGRELTGMGRDRAVALLGPEAVGASSLSALAARLPSTSRWALDGLDQPDLLWQGEERWWARVESDGRALLADPVFGPAPVLGVVAVLACDAHRVRAALELASRGGHPLEALNGR